MKRFLKIIALFCAPLLCIPAVNITIDPSNVYSVSHAYERQIVALLQTYRFVINVSSKADDRITKKMIVDSCKYEADVIVVGSSRVKLISSEMLNDKTLINLGVNGATYEDMCALLYFYMTKQSIPKIVILGIDPQHFNQNINDTRWKTLQREYNNYRSEVLHLKLLSSADYDKWKNLLSLKYFQESCNSINEAFKSGENFKYIGCDTLPNHDFKGGLCNDGSTVVGRTSSPKTLEERRELAYTLQYHQWENYNELSQDYKYKWQMLVNFLISQNIKIYFWQAAYHPITYERLMTEDKNREMKHAMEYINEFAKEYNIEIIGSYNPEVLGLEEDDFSDGMHMKNNAVKMYIESFAFE